MIALNSSEWQNVAASVGGDGVATARLLERMHAGDQSVFGELYHQVCHQNTVGEVAYLAVPHLVEIARKEPATRRALPLLIVGSVVASRAAYPSSAAKPPEKARAEFLVSIEEARLLAADTLKEHGLERETSFMLLETLSAIHGHVDLALLMERGLDLSCPSCGEEITFREE